MSPSSACMSITMSCLLNISSSSPSLNPIEMHGNSIDMRSSLKSKPKSSAEDDALLRCRRGVGAGDGRGDGNGDGSGVGISLIGDKHLLTDDGTSNRIVGGCKKLLPPSLDLCALRASNTGTSMVLCDCRCARCVGGESGGLLEKDTGVCIDEVVDSSSPATSSCGLDAVGVVDGEIRTDAG